jgi:predicted  nucleic acid-binding Zn-ribbon protein
MYYFQIKTMQVETTEKNEALTAKMQEHTDLQHEKDELEQQLLEVRKELDGAYHTIANQVTGIIKYIADIVVLYFQALLLFVSK